MLQKNYNVYMPIILGKVNEKHNIARIWVYEMTLTFASRFLNDDNINWLIILLDKGEKKNFDTNENKVCPFGKWITYCDFITLDKLEKKKKFVGGVLSFNERINLKYTLY